MKLYCHTDLIMEGDRNKCTTKGKTYSAEYDSDGDFVIFDDEGDRHHFTKEGYRQWFNDIDAPVELKAKPTVIKLPNAKIVLNPPYTIYTDGKVTGKAKCNPAEEYKAEVGLQLAVERYSKAKTEKIFKVTFQNDRHYGLPETVSATLAKKIDEEIWGMFTRAVGGKR